MTRLAALAAAVLAAGVAQAKPQLEPSTGVAFQPRTGWFAETQIGIFTAMGGSKTFSNGQPFLGVSLGMDLPSMPELAVFATVGTGFNADSCRGDLDEFGGCPTYELD